MLSYKFNKSLLCYQLILFFSFAISINYFVELKYVNLIFYIIFHITFIYLAFYFYNFSLFLLGFIYGMIFDLILINYIAPHLLALLLLLLIISLIRKNLFNLKANKISYIIFLFLFVTILIEMIFASILFNYDFKINVFSSLIVMGLIIFIPIIYLYSKIDKL